MAAGRALLGAPCSSLAAGARRLAFASPQPRALVPALRRRVPGRCVTSVSSSPGAASAPEPYVLTTPLYYVNAPPHMGSAYTTIAADAIARFQASLLLVRLQSLMLMLLLWLQRLLGKKVIFITGTDEHGEKIATSAEASGRNPKEHCDAISSSYKILWDDLDIEYDKFIRTTDHKHEAVVNEFYSRVLNSGDIYRADYEGLYCVSCEEYKDEKELGENNSCPVHLKPCVARKEDNYFFALSKYQHKLEDLLARNPDFVRPSHRLNEVRFYSYSLYALFCLSMTIGYISALIDDGEQASLQQAIDCGWPASLHLIGKDILRFHAVYWPAMLMSAGISVPDAVFGHGFLTKDGMKMGKSLGNTLEPKDLVERFGADAVRYFFLREVEFGNDGDYSEERFINIVNAHLANTIGNLLNRTLGLLKKNCKSTLAFDSIAAADGIPFRENVENLVDKAKHQYENLLLSSACESVLEISNLGNLYIDEQAPWSCFRKGGESTEKAAKDLVIILETMRIIAIALCPIAPSLSLRIYSQLGFTEDQFRLLRWEDTKWGGLKAGQVMMEPKPVFARIETETEETAQTNSKAVKGGKKKAQSKGLVEA
ncbi:hypothetical protein HU200_048457 [Digitaria exilis]|uniref:methionine--tRNA ligase n=1 Tax=Digitaria exilis TaxID=1010633 RepID=A0A835ASM1_9POAL|nr:hypothetical protein HU200_048457 [Digitaria exilis]